MTFDVRPTLPIPQLQAESSSQATHQARVGSHQTPLHHDGWGGTPIKAPTQDGKEANQAMVEDNKYTKDRVAWLYDTVKDDSADCMDLIEQHIKIKDNAPLYQTQAAH